ncbi:M91 family zinc metallopeptidase [Haliangium sp.]|uniref:M91 family zinc metallopeptidase n=1 Tax=Haliangium sp. TaxID=2663208 RepID=UPI003D14D6A3
MSNEFDKRSSPDGARGAKDSARRQVSPGKVTPTSRLGPAAGTPVQRSAAGASAPRAGVKTAAEWTADPWMDAAHRGTVPPALAGGGHAPIQRKAAGAAIQMEGGDQAPPGRGLCTEFGDYWIVPDSTTTPVAGVEGEQITETEFSAVQADWNKVKDGSGQIRITETDSSGVQHGGFQASILQRIGLLMSRPTGRQLVRDLVNGSQTVTIRPSAAQIYGGANAIRGSAATLEQADGSSGGGGTTIIQIDPNCSDTDIKVYDAGGNEIADPVYIFLGHEMIHARHNQAGRNRRNLAATDPAYSNREEQETVEGAGISENALRREHGLTERHGSGGRDVR